MVGTRGASSIVPSPSEKQPPNHEVNETNAVAPPSRAGRAQPHIPMQRAMMRRYHGPKDGADTLCGMQQRAGNGAATPSLRLNINPALRGGWYMGGSKMGGLLPSTRDEKTLVTRHQAVIAHRHQYLSMQCQAIV
jgi:hypothetical protein